MKIAVFILAVVALSCPRTQGHEFTEQQLEPWKALNAELATIMQRDWDKHRSYLHPKVTLWGDKLPAPLSIDADEYLNNFFSIGKKAVSHHLVPVSVVVVDDVAIINAYLHILTEEDEKPAEFIYRLHNTWKKDGNQWKLLATYNTVVATPGEQDD